jgi:hypothetical protein
MNKLIIGNFLKKTEISVMGKKMKLKLDEIKVESFITGEKIDGGLPPPTYPCNSEVGQYCTTNNSCPTVCTCPTDCGGFCPSINLC